MISDLRRAVPGFAVGAAAAIFSVVSYPRLPEQMPIHWNSKLQPDGWGSPLGALAILPAITLLLPLLMLLVVRIDPLRENYPKHRSTWWTLVNILMVALAAIQLVVVGTGLGFDVTKAIPLIIGALFILLGNYTPRVKRNWWLGLRTPWTLSSEEVWRKTHRLGGKTLAGAGILMLLGSLLLPSALALFLVVAATVGALVPVVYSYFLWRAEQQAWNSSPAE